MVALPRLLYPCICTGVHPAPYRGTRTPGLVITDNNDLFCPVTHPHGRPALWSDGWTITHIATGLHLGFLYPDAETAQNVAAELDGVAEWEADDPFPGGREGKEARTMFEVLAYPDGKPRHGAERVGTSGTPDRVRLNDPDDDR